MAAKILIVEDMDSVAQLIGVQLQKAGFETAMAPDAFTAFTQALKFRPDAIVLDLMLPAGGGAAVLKRLRGSVHTQHVPVLVLTGTTDPAIRKTILDYGVKTVMQKPHNADDLIAALQQLLSSHR